MTFEELLVSKGATCSTCGNSFSDQNPPQIEELANTFNDKPVIKALCRNPPFVHSHNVKQQASIKVVYKSVRNKLLTL